MCGTIGDPQGFQTAMDIGDELLRQRTAGRNAPNAKENKVRTIGGSMICDLKTWSAGFRGCSLLGDGQGTKP